MIYHLVVIGSAKHSLAAHTALAFAKTLAESTHQLAGVFFFRDGVDIADTSTQISADWQHFAALHQIELVCCIASLQRRGLADNDTTAAKFSIGGLGLYAEALIKADRVMHFG